MDSIYWVISRDCNQRCRHCYNNSEPGAEGLSFDEVDRVVEHFPAAFPIGKIILSGGEVLHFAGLLFHTLKRLYERYGDSVPLFIQTNGDLLDEPMLDRLLAAHVRHISVSGIDGFHPRSTIRRKDYLEGIFRSRGMISKGDVPPVVAAGDGYRDFNFWGATPDMWIGKIWPRGRAIETRVSRAGPEDDFCNRWSGAVSFLNANGEGSEVNIQLAAVYPCCPMTVRPIGDLRHESLEAILDRCRDNPVYQALNRGRPEEMGVHMGLSAGYADERTRALGNCCLWCDEFFLKHYAGEQQMDSPRIPGARLDLVPISRLLSAAATP
ncbi:MAG: radical SAM protein [Bryobacteraceae bacterium]